MGSTQIYKRQGGFDSSVYVIESASVDDGVYEYPIGTLSDGVDIFLDEFRFVDEEGDTVIAGAGTVQIQVSSGGAFWRTLNNGSFNATIDTASEAYTPPSGLAAATKLRIILLGVTGAFGFRANLVRG